MTQMIAPDRSATAPARLSTRLSFLAAGFAVSCWAPLIPFAKSNVGADEAILGILLLCLGMGSVIAMPITGVISARRGARGMILLGGFGMGITLPLLVLAGSPVALGMALFVFGASLGTLDVAMNVHGAEVERQERRPLMSGFHAQFSIGGFTGAGLMTALLSFGLSPLASALIGAVLTLGTMTFVAPRLMRARGGDPEPFALPRGIVLLLALLAAIAFLVEGAILDWGALLLIDREMSEVRMPPASRMAAEILSRSAADSRASVSVSRPAALASPSPSARRVASATTSPRDDPSAMLLSGIMPDTTEFT